MKVGGKHLIIDIKDSHIDMVDMDTIENECEKWINKTKSSVVNKVSYEFSNGGFSCVWLLSESHMSVHTFPEEKGISIDLFTCGDIDPFLVKDDITSFFGGVHCVSCLARSA